MIHQCEDCIVVDTVICFPCFLSRPLEPLRRTLKISQGAIRALPASSTSAAFYGAYLLVGLDGMARKLLVDSIL